MGRGENARAKKGSDQALALSKQYGGGAKDVNSVLFPALSKDVNNPEGLSPTDLAAINTADQQSLGGSLSSLFGQGELEAARTRNAGGSQAAMGEASREGMRRSSENALNVQMKNAMLKEAQKQQARSTMAGLYGTNVSGSVGGLGANAANVNAATNAGNNGWFQNLISLMNSGKS